VDEGRHTSYQRRLPLRWGSVHSKAVRWASFGAALYVFVLSHARGDCGVRGSGRHQQCSGQRRAAYERQM